MIEDFVETHILQASCVRHFDYPVRRIGVGSNAGYTSRMWEGRIHTPYMRRTKLEAAEFGESVCVTFIHGFSPKSGTPGHFSAKFSYMLKPSTKHAPGALLLLIGQADIVTEFGSKGQGMPVFFCSVLLPTDFGQRWTNQRDLTYTLLFLSVCVSLLW